MTDTADSAARSTWRSLRAGGWSTAIVNSLPGLLAAAHLANLLFFLNPNLPFEARTLVRVFLPYAGLLGAASCVLLTPLTWRRPHRARRLLPWTATAVLSAVAVLDWLYAARYPFFLPPGINARIIKAAIWLTLSALFCFYTALLHTLHRRPYGIRSRLGMVLVTCASILVMAERREAFQPPPLPAPRPSVVELGQRPTLFVIGLDGASLDAVLPLARQGRLPFFARLLQEGVHGRPQSLAPVQLEALWTTLATGTMPYRHGIVSSQVHSAELVSPDAHVSLLPTRISAVIWRLLSSIRRVDATFRQTSAMWEVLERSGLSYGLVGWPVTDPVEETAAFSFSHRYFGGDFRQPTARPPELAERGLLFQIDPEEVDPGLLEQLDSRVPYPYLQALAADLWREGLTRFLLDQQPRTGALFLMLPGLAEISQRNFGGYAAVQFYGVQRRPYREAAQLVTAYYRHLDSFLAALWQQHSGPRLFAIVSAYGFEAPEGWSRLWAQITGRALRGRSQRAPDGLFILAGEGVRAGQFLEDIDLVDVAPTLLYALSLPIARDLDGQVLTGAFDSGFLARNPLTFVPSYDTLLAEDSGPRPPPS